MSAAIEAKRGPGRPRAALSPGMILTIRNCADQLDRSLALRVGAMDSLSRIEEVQRQQREILMTVVGTLRALA